MVIMKKEIGLWIDHHKAVIVILTLQGEVMRHIESAIESPAQLPGLSTGDGSQVKISDWQFANRMDRYYATIVHHIQDAESILIFGPGEAKDELEKQLERSGLEDHIVDIQNDGEMTDRQISGKVRRYFPDKRRLNYNLEETQVNST